jgi:8-oxo-dGTP diphosphatase
MNEDCFHLGIKALIRNKEGKILLLKVNKKTLKKHVGEEYWDIPGGRIHRDSTVQETLKREIKEETGLDIKSIRPIGMVLSNIRIPMDRTDVGLILSVYDCSLSGNNKVILSPEHIDAQWFDPKKASVLLEIKYPKEFTEKIAEL